MKPIGFTNGSNGQRFGVAHIEYYSSWNRDDGLVTGTGCAVAMTTFYGLAGLAATVITDMIGPHKLDNERTATLVVFPATAGDVYSTNINDWRSIAAYTAAHEGTDVDRSENVSYVGQGDGFPFVPKLTISLAKSKHGSYPFSNPQGISLLPGWAIGAAIAGVQIIQDPIKYAIANAAVATAVNLCFTEKFNDPGSGRLPEFFVNIGEPNAPLNDSGWILDSGKYGIFPKLNEPIWVINN